MIGCGRRRLFCAAPFFCDIGNYGGQLASIPYASAIRSGRRVPHPRHWQALAQLVGVLPHA